MAKNLTTTSFAILGLLALRPWSTYELADQMQRALGLFWPRASSGIYEEPKKLVALGLAKATAEQVGQRPRTSYSITAKGRGALEAWVPTPGAGPVVDFEQLVKIFFAEHASRADLLATLHGVRTDLEDRVAASADIPTEYLEGRGGYPDRLPWLILAGKFLDEIDQAVDRWAQWAINVVDDWPDDLHAAEPDREALQEMARNAEAFVERAATRHAAGSA